MVDRSASVIVAAAVVLLAGASGAVAQTAGLDEAVKPDGTLVPRLTLTPDQEHLVARAVASERVKPRSGDVPAVIGAPVPHAIELPELPVQDRLAIEGVPVLKYAMLERDIVVIDPVEMRVVAVIRHERVQP